jgi:hypothetical protein
MLTSTTNWPSEVKQHAEECNQLAATLSPSSSRSTLWCKQRGFGEARLAVEHSRRHNTSDWPHRWDTAVQTRAHAPAALNLLRAE